MFQQKTFKTYFFLFFAFSVHWTLMMQPVALAAGRIENRLITSKIMAEAGRVPERELSVYLPEGYDTSGLAYPVLYLLHGGWWFGCGLQCSNRVFFEGQYAVVFSVDKLIEDGKIKPLIIVSPNVEHPIRAYPTKALLLNDRLLVRDYVSQEIIPFVDANYRTIPGRKGRAISGWSNGGLGVLFIGFSLPEKFSLVGTYSGGATLAGGGEFLIERDLVVAHKQGDFPLQFWVYVGRNDEWGFLPINRQLVQALEEANLPHVYIEDDGTHSSRIVERVLESIVYFSERLVGNVVAVQPRDKLATTWGEVKRGS